jgi:hypothetical protein
MMSSPIRKTPACIALALLLSPTVGYSISRLPGVRDWLYSSAGNDLFERLFNASEMSSYYCMLDFVSAVLNVAGFFVALIIANLSWTIVCRYRRTRPPKPKKKAWIKSSLICIGLALLLSVPVGRWIILLLDVTGWLRTSASDALFHFLNRAFDAQGCEETSDVFTATMLVAGFTVSLLLVIALRSFARRRRDPQHG